MLLLQLLLLCCMQARQSCWAWYVSSVPCVCAPNTTTTACSGTWTPAPPACAPNPSIVDTGLTARATAAIQAWTDCNSLHLRGMLLTALPA
jgi:hypothetical protein